MHTTHRWLSILEGCLLVALGIHLLSSSHLLISGTAGLGLILQRITPLNFGELFFLLNLPFYLLAFLTMGKGFTVRTFIAITLLAVLSELMRRYLYLEIEQPLVAAALGGMLVGFGLILLFRHQASLGGINILAVYLEQRMNIHAGLTTAIADVIILSLSFFTFNPMEILYSLVAFAMLSSVVSRYHKPPAWARTTAQQAEVRLKELQQQGILE
jgi:uncharacterized membrane-anchored protein YitT (DUF2179 family)